jgi:hypothetical protein
VPSGRPNRDVAGICPPVCQGYVDDNGKSISRLRGWLPHPAAVELKLVVESRAKPATYFVPMKTADLTQARLLVKKEFTLEENGVAVFEKNLSRSKKYHVYFDNIPPKAQEFTVGSRGFVAGAVVAAILTAFCSILLLIPGTKVEWDAPIFWGIMAIILWAFYFSTRKALLLFVQNGGGLVLFKDKPSAQSVDSFVKKLFQQRNNYLLRKYGRFSNEESFENKMGRLNYLRTQEVITEQEFEAKREEFTGKKTTGPLGFAPQQN